MLLLSAGRDITDLLPSYHPFSDKPMKYLASRKVRATPMLAILSHRCAHLTQRDLHTLMSAVKHSHMCMHTHTSLHSLPVSSTPTPRGCRPCGCPCGWGGWVAVLRLVRFLTPSSPSSPRTLGSTAPFASVWGSTSPRTTSTPRVPGRACGAWPLCLPWPHSPTASRTVRAGVAGCIGSVWAFSSPRA